MKELEETINQAVCDLVLVATPVDLTRVLSLRKPSVRIEYEYRDNSDPILEAILRERLGN